MKFIEYYWLIVNKAKCWKQRRG